MPITFKDKPLEYANGRRVNAEEWNGFSRTTETDKLPFGVPVQAGSGRHTCKEITAKDQVVIGITETSQILPTPGDYYDEYDTVAICESGVIGVVVAKSVTKGAQARWNPSTDKWTDAAEGPTALTIPGAFFEETGGGDGEVVALRYRNVPGGETADGT